MTDIGAEDLVFTHQLRRTVLVQTIVVTRENFSALAYVTRAEVKNPGNGDPMFALLPYYKMLQNRRHMMYAGDVLLITDGKYSTITQRQAKARYQEISEAKSAEINALITQTIGGRP